MFRRFFSGKNTFWVATAGIILLYWLTRLVSLTALPVFADESIYLRWAQLILTDEKYLFFSMNDGKPPLFIWLLVPVLQLFSNPLFAGRILSAAIGFLQLLVLDRLVRELGGKTAERLVTALLVILTPFWYFHHRMALMDGLLVLGLSSMLLGLFQLDRLTRNQKDSSLYSTGLALLTAGTGFGLALWTKTPALFLAPFFVIMAYVAPWLRQPVPRKTWSAALLGQRTFWFALAGTLGLGIFLILKLQPNFGTLFGRSTDFTYTVRELLDQQGLPLWRNLQRVTEWLGRYLRPEFLSLALVSILVSKRWRLHVLLWLGALTFAAPLLLLGKTLHPRYFLPVAPFLTLSVALFTVEVSRLIQKAKQQELQALGILVGLFFLVGSLRFIFFSWFDPNQIPFVLHDREQYLTEWSSGHGIKQVEESLIREVQQGKRVTVITEGSFGTLPDALLMYFFNRPEIESLKIEGLGQYPVKTIPEWAWQEAEDHPVWLVVNSHRNALPPEVQQQLYLEARYPRPYGGPYLEVYSLKPTRLEK